MVLRLASQAGSIIYEEFCCTFPGAALPVQIHMYMIISMCIYSNINMFMNMNLFVLLSLCVSVLCT
jgi:hypothetical protein